MGPVTEVPTPPVEGGAAGDKETLLSIEGVGIGFGGLLALDDVSMSVRDGEVVGVIGPNGAGKTTLFNVISGFVHPGSGTLTYRGRVLRRHHPHDLTRLGIARTLQGIGLCAGLTVHENVMLGAEPVLRSDLGSSFLGIWRSSREERRVAARAMEVLEELGAADYARMLPGSLPYAISKRTALARALMAEPRLLLLDEPASGLSEKDMADLGQRIRGLTERMAVLLVEHHMDLVMAVCDRLVVLNFGQVIAQGTPADIQADPEVATAYLGTEVHDAHESRPIHGVRTEVQQPGDPGVDGA